MTAFLLLLCPLLGLVLWCYWYTIKRASEIKHAFPPVGEIASVNGLDVHYVDREAASHDAPIVVFLHGASGNLRDPLYVFADRLDGKVRQIFIDRPGHGWSERGPDMATPTGQARQVIALLDHLNIHSAILVGHSWSGTLIATLAVLYPERVSALLFNAAVSHPWPGGVNWYYHVAAIPIIGRLFASTLTLPIGERQLKCATDKVFWPNPVPEYYEKEIGTDMVLVPDRFHANSMDIADLRSHVVAMSPRYGEIKVPTTIITGDKDQVILPWVHSDGLERTIKHAKRIDLKHTGHMPHHTAPDLYAREILRLADLVKADKAEAAE